MPILTAANGGESLAQCSGIHVLGSKLLVYRDAPGVDYDFIIFVTEGCRGARLFMGFVDFCESARLTCST